MLMEKLYRDQDLKRRVVEVIWYQFWFSNSNISASFNLCRSVNSWSSVYAIVEICERSIYKNSTNYWSDYSLPCRHQYIIRANRFRLGQF